MRRFPDTLGYQPLQRKRGPFGPSFGDDGPRFRSQLIDLVLDANIGAVTIIRSI